ncbi:unnamed protein product [Effrenium voratum]|nr:unnamed protein product [Effrenium voratum]
MAAVAYLVPGWCGPSRGPGHTKVRRGRKLRHLRFQRDVPAPALEGRLEMLQLPTRFIGGAYFLLMLSVPPADAFMAVNKPPEAFPRTNLTLLLDSGLTAAVMLTSEVCKSLKLAVGSEGNFSSGLGAIGSMEMQQVRVEGAALSDGEESYPLSPLAGVVVDNFPQLKIADEVGVVLQGMLGQGFMDQFDLELDAARKQVRAWPRASLPADSGPHWRQLEALGMPGRLQGLLLTVPGCLEPVVGLVDTGASHTLTEEELSESSVLAQDLLRRGALALLFFASRAKRQKGEKDEKQACNALLCIRLLAQQLQVLANVTEGWETELQDLAVVLGHWVSTDWCSPRIEVVGYLPCCSTPGSFLLGHCSHNALKAVLDVVMCEPQIPSSLDVCRAYGGWRRSQIRTGTALHRWEEVTAAGLALLAAAHDRAERAVLVCGGDSLLASFLAQHAPEVEVDFLEQAEVLPLLQQHMGLRLGGPGRAPGSRRVVADVAHGPAQPSKPSEPSEPAVSSEPSTYDAVVQLAGATGKLKLRAGGCLLVERAKSSDGLELTDLTDLGEEPETSESALFLEEPLSPFQDLIRPELWFARLLERGGVQGGAPDVLVAQRSQVVRAGRLDMEDLAALRALAMADLGSEVRSPGSAAWQVMFLQSDGFFETHAPKLLQRLSCLARSVALQEGWLSKSQAERLQARVVEWHCQESPGPGIPDPRHYDMDSLVTVDVMCSDTWTAI